MTSQNNKPAFPEVPQLGSDSAYSATLMVAFINLVGMSLVLRVVWPFPVVPRWPLFGSAAMGVALFSVLVLCRKIADLRFCSIIYLINNISVVSALFITQAHFSSHASRWVPFQGNKLACVIAATLAPTFSVGTIAIGLMGGSALFNYFSLSQNIRFILPIGEPYAMMAFTIISLMLLRHRTKRQLAERELAYAHAQAATAKKFARVFLRLRDLTNNPLQNLEFSLELLRLKPANSDETMDRMSKALKELRKIDGILDKYEALVPWETADLSTLATDPESPGNQLW